MDQTTIKAPRPIISADVEQEITSAFEVLFHAMNTYGDTVAPSFQAAGIKGWERVTVRALNAYQARQAHLKELEIAEFRQGVRDVIGPVIDQARAEREEYDQAKAAMSPKLAALLAPFPTFVTVPLSALSEVFGANVDTQAQVKKLVAMSYRVSKGANDTYSVRVELPKGIAGDSK